MYIIKSRKEMKDAIDMDRKYYDTQNDLFMKRTNDHLVQIKKYGGKVLAVTNGRQALRLVPMEKNARYVPVRE